MDEDWSERLAAHWTEIMALCWMTSALGTRPSSIVTKALSDAARAGSIQVG